MELQPPVLDLLDDRRVQQRAGITQAIQFTLRDLPQDPTHDLPAPRFGQTADQLDLIRFRDRADDPGHRLDDIFPDQRLVSLIPVENYIGIDTLSLYVMGISYHRALDHARMHIDRILHFRRTDPVPADIQDIIHPARDPVIAFAIAQGAVPGEIEFRV